VIIGVIDSEDLYPLLRAIYVETFFSVISLHVNAMQFRRA